MISWVRPTAKDGMIRLPPAVWVRWKAATISSRSRPSAGAGGRRRVDSISSRSASGTGRSGSRSTGRSRMPRSPENTSLRGRPRRSPSPRATTNRGCARRRGSAPRPPGRAQGLAVVHWLQQAQAVLGLDHQVQRWLDAARGRPLLRRCWCAAAIRTLFPGCGRCRQQHLEQVDGGRVA